MTTPSNDNQIPVSLPLSGSHGANRFFRVDAADEGTAARFGPWSLVPNGCGGLYVRSTRREIAASTNQPSGAGLVSLSRLLMDAPRDRVVTFLDGDPLNLTRGNLAVLTKAEAAQRRRDRGTA